jgi:basic membrane protein A and related proteins
MRTRSLGLTLFAGLSIFVAACSGGSSSPAASAAASAAAPSAAASTAASPSAAASAAASPSAAASESAAASASASASASAGTSDLKIGVVTDIGTLDDKNYNEYTYKGVQAGAAAIGAANPPAVVPKDASEYASKIQAYVAQGFNMIVTVGFNLGAATGEAAVKNPTITFIGVDQSPICITKEGKQDFTFPCPLDSKTVAPNYISIAFQEDQAGYLAGIIAASVSKSGVIGAIGGTSLCAPCIRYMQGYVLGAKSIKSDIQVKTAFVTDDFSNAAFNDPVGGKKYGAGFITTNKGVDVLFQVAGKTGNGILDSACEAKILGVGVDVDQALSYPNAAKCTITSAEKHLQIATASVIQQLNAGEKISGTILFDAKTRGIGVSPGHDLASQITPDIQKKVDDAMAAMVAGTLKTCTDKCGALPVQ